MDKQKDFDKDINVRSKAEEQKQIEELTNKICSVLFIKSAQPNCSDCYFSDDCGYKVLAEELLKYYQPKIPENAVVIEQSEYNKLRLLADECLDWRRKNCNVDEIRKELTEGGGQ